jgi:hypothetical protein
MKKYAFFHSAIMNNFPVVNNQVIDSVFGNGLIDELDKLYICNLGGDYRFDKYHKNIEYINVGYDIKEYEFPTLKKVQEKAKQEECYIMYFSNLGVGHNNTPTAKSWRDLLDYFVIRNYKDRLKELEDGYDITGAEWCDLPLPHYSGTWWWSNSKYINTLIDIYECKEKLEIPNLNSIRHRAEMWIGTNSSVKAKSNFDCGFIWYEKPQRTNWLDYIK